MTSEFLHEEISMLCISVKFHGWWCGYIAIIKLQAPGPSLLEI